MCKGTTAVGEIGRPLAHDGPSRGMIRSAFRDPADHQGSVRSAFFVSVSSDRPKTTWVVSGTSVAVRPALERETR
jgi:hypothetical protein